MALKIQSIRGTRDVVPSQSYKWQYVERVAMEVAATYGMNDIRIPTMEKTELFVRSVGDTTDVVQKEMYTFEKGKESITLRPEATSGIVRAVLENGLLSETLPIKVATIISCFRHENPQSGRLREFHQFDVESLGCQSPTADAEVIGVAVDLFDRLGLQDITLYINSIGCPKCRPAYNKLLVDYYTARKDQLCETCLDRLEKNPLRLLDCKEDRCQQLSAEAPLIVDHLCEECADHFDGLKQRLDAMNIPYNINPKIVRGLDYYTKTVFEFVTTAIGSQGTVCGGGRYDGLMEHMGGPFTPALGFGLGLERLIMLMEASGCEFPPPPACDVYIGSTDEQANVAALSLCTPLRREGFNCLCDIVGRSVKAQMKYADKLDARYSCILGDEEIQSGKVLLREMATGETAEVALNADAFREFLYDKLAVELLEADDALAEALDLLQDEQEKGE